MLFLDGVYTFDHPRPRFHRAPRPTPAELARLLHAISTRVARLLERIVPKRKPDEAKPDKPLASMTWMQRLKRVFSIDIETCPKCGGKLRVIACIEDADIIVTILEHIQIREAASQPRAPPSLIDYPNTPNQDRLF
jgi:hypothetical protein